jgi:hypothetical protein
MKHPLCLFAPFLILLWVCVSQPSSVCAASSPPSSASEKSGIESRQATVTIPGPLRSFLRMAAISQKVSPDEVVPLLSRNVFLIGYNGLGRKGQPTEFLLLLRRYVQQARELAALAGPDGAIHASNCEDAKPLLRILGYKTPADCGPKNNFLQTADPQRAFLTTDSGFPLSELERTLSGGAPFAYQYPHSQVPIFLTEADWTAVSAKAGNGDVGKDLLDVLLHDPVLAHLYYAWAHMDPETQVALQRSPGLNRFVPLVGSLDFYGSYIRIRSGRVVVPGGSGAESAWKELVGSSPESPADFILHLLAKDNGWLAAYFDSLSRIPPEQQAHFVELPRLRRCYENLRGKNASPSAMASVFRPDPDLLVLMTRLQWQPNGDPRVPGNLEVWKTILGQKATSNIARDWGVRVNGWNDPEGLLEALFALSRAPGEGGPTEVFLALSELDGRRPAERRLSPPTIQLLAGKYSEFRDQYLIFSEFPQLGDASIALFLKTASAIGKISDHTLRGNAMGIFQANVSLWQILSRQGEIEQSKQDDSWRRTIAPFARVSSPAQLFDAGRASLGEILRAATGEPEVSQEEIVDLLAGPGQTSAQGQRIHRELAERIRAVLDDQRLVSLDTLLALGNGLSAMAQAAPGSTMGDTLIPLAEQLTEFQMPQPIFTRGERTEFTAGTYNNRHTEIEMRTDLAKVLKTPASAAQLEEARGQLAPFLRDTLVGFSYAYYQPPGAQALHNNSLVVRSHDFSGETIMGVEKSLWQNPRLFGAGSPAGGGAHLVGSLANLPYVLAKMEEDFISPENVQALIWADLVPSVLTGAVLPRWWGVSRNELHAVALYQRAGEELLSASAENAELRSKVMDLLSDRMSPQRLAQLEDVVREGIPAEISSQVTPADTFYLTAGFRQKFPGDTNSWGPAGRELANLVREDPAELIWDRLSRDFGAPHPTLARTYSRELLNVRLFPMFAGYSSRLFAETWDSTNLYWARLADEAGYQPEMLNRLVPELTVRMVAKIFATDLNDWPAILRAMRETGAEFQRGKVASLSSNSGHLQP